MRIFRSVWKLLIGFYLTVVIACTANAFVKGIYLTQPTLENAQTVQNLIKQAKEVGIGTFIIDMEKPSKLYEKNIQLVKSNNINYVARIVVFPDGGEANIIHSKEYWEKKYKLVKAALDLGAQQIQLDYIRYNSRTHASPQNAKDIHRIIQWFKSKLALEKKPLQVDVFGIASFGEESHIGQNIKLFSQTVDGLCPMVYPSHYEPYLEHAVTPYHTILKSLMAIKSMFNTIMPFKLYPYIELSNYRYRLSPEKRIEYIYAQIRAVQDAGADGWYAWSPHNQYDYLFQVLKNYRVK